MSTHSSSRQRRLYRAQSLLSEIISVRASLGQLPQETAELPLTGLMSAGGDPVSPDVNLSDEPALSEFAPVSLSELKPPTLGEAGHFDVQDELKEALLEASAAHTGETDELALNPSTDLEAALREALDEVNEEATPDERGSLEVSQPTPIAYHPNQPAPMRALWGRRGFTPTPEVIDQEEAQPVAPRLAFEESQELLELIDAPQSLMSAEEQLSDEPVSEAPLERHAEDGVELSVSPSEGEPLVTAAYAPLTSEVELSSQGSLDELASLEPSTSSKGHPASEGQEEQAHEGFGGVSRSPDEPQPEVLERAWTEVASPEASASGRGSRGRWVTLILLALGAAGVYYYVRFML